MDNHQLHVVDIFGYSMGGYVALWFAKNQPGRIGKIITLGTKFDWRVGAAEKEVKKLNPEKIVRIVHIINAILILHQFIFGHFIIESAWFFEEYKEHVNERPVG